MSIFVPRYVCVFILPTKSNIQYIQMYVDTLIGICQPSHTAHDTQHVVVSGIHTHGGGEVGAHSVGRHSQQQRGVVDTRQVARAAGLVLLRVECKGIHVDTHGRDVGVVLVRLHPVEVVAVALLEPIMAVELDLGHDGRVLAGHALDTGYGVTRLED